MLESCCGSKQPCICGWIKVKVKRKSITSASEAESITEFQICLFQNCLTYHQSGFHSFPSTCQIRSSKCCSPSVSLLHPLLVLLRPSWFSTLVLWVPVFVFSAILGWFSPYYLFYLSPAYPEIKISVSEPNFVDVFPNSYTCLTSSYPHSWLCHTHTSLLLMLKQLFAVPHVMFMLERVSELLYAESVCEEREKGIAYCSLFQHSSSCCMGIIRGWWWERNKCWERLKTTALTWLPSNKPIALGICLCDVWWIETASPCLHLGLPGGCVTGFVWPRVQTKVLH